MGVGVGFRAVLRGGQGRSAVSAPDLEAGESGP